LTQEYRDSYCISTGRVSIARICNSSICLSTPATGYVLQLVAAGHSAKKRSGRAPGRKPNPREHPILL
jgi:hypothetical protein